jgi:hypothetical protein
MVGATVAGAPHGMQLKQQSWVEPRCGAVEPSGPVLWQMYEAGSNPAGGDASWGQATTARIACRAITTIATDPANLLIA